MEVRELESTTFSRLSMKFLTSKHSGILFLAAGHSDYLLMELHAGEIQVGYYTGYPMWLTGVKYNPGLLDQVLSGNSLSRVEKYSAE